MIGFFGIRHMLLVKRLQHEGTQLDLEGALLRPQSPLMSALAAQLPFNGSGISTYVMDQILHGQRLQGFAQTCQRQAGTEKDVVYLAPSLTRDENAALIWQRLLEHVCAMEGNSGVQRLFSKLPEGDDEAMGIFRRAGFGAYVQEYVYCLDQVPAGRSMPEAASLRPQAAEDAWALQRLYYNTAPRLVQQTECLVMDVGGNWPLHRLADGDDRRYVLEADGEIVGYVRVTSGKRAHWLKLLLHPDAAEQGELLVGWGLTLLREQLLLPVYCSVRAYETGLQDALEKCAFQRILSRWLLVKHTTVRIKEPSVKLIPALEKGVKPAAPISSTKAASSATGGVLNWSRDWQRRR